jgi:hypothetical protein
MGRMRVLSLTDEAGFEHRCSEQPSYAGIAAWDSGAPATMYRLHALGTFFRLFIYATHLAGVGERESQRE